jgi:hypothetical protein
VSVLWHRGGDEGERRRWFFSIVGETKELAFMTGAVASVGWPS